MDRDECFVGVEFGGDMYYKWYEAQMVWLHSTTTEQKEYSHFYIVYDCFEFFSDYEEIFLKMR